MVAFAEMWSGWRKQQVPMVKPCALRLSWTGLSLGARYDDPVAQAFVCACGEQKHEYAGVALRVQADLVEHGHFD